MSFHDIYSGLDDQSDWALEILRVAGLISARIAKGVYPFAVITDRVSTRCIPAVPGVYFVMDEFDHILYIGKSQSIRERLGGKPHKNIASAIKKGAVKVGWQEVSLHDAFSVEQLLIARLCPSENRGFYNAWWTDWRYGRVVPQLNAFALHKETAALLENPISPVFCWIDSEVRDRLDRVAGTMHIGTTALYEMALEHGLKCLESGGGSR